MKETDETILIITENDNIYTLKLKFKQKKKQEIKH